MKRDHAAMFSILALTLFSLPAYGLWGGYVGYPRPAPVVKACEAEECVGVAPGAVTSDSRANDGKGGKAVTLTPGGSGLTTEMHLESGIYMISMIAMNPEAKPGVALMALQVKEQKTGPVGTWTMPVSYGKQYGPVGRMYFPAHTGGEYTITVVLALTAPSITVDGGSLGGDVAGTAKFRFDQKTKALAQPPALLLVDRLEVADAMEYCAKKGFKTKRMLTSDEELAQIRREYAAGKIQLATPDYDKVRTRRDAAQSRRERNDELWGKAPDFNELTGFHEYDREVHGWLLGGYRGRGVVVESADWYEKTGDPGSGWDGAVSLCALAEKYPAFDPMAQLAAGNRYMLMGNKFGDIGRFATAYDRLFDFIKDNQELADYVGSKVAWVKTPADVVRFLDTYLLQAGYDSLYGHMYGGLATAAIIPVVQGVCEESDRMLDRGVFRAFECALPHKFYIPVPLDDTSYISPFRTEIWEAAEYLHRYRLAGGSPRYDLYAMHPGYSTQKEIEQWEQVHLSGGFRAAMPALARETRVEFLPGWPDRGPAKVGGHMAMFVTITQSSPSRVLENVHGTHVAMDLYSLSILESGQFQDDLLKMRGAWVQYNQLGLPLQATAHGGLSLTHFNRQSHQEVGRPAVPGKAGPPGRAYNIVEVDSLRNLPRVNLTGVNFLVGEGKAFPAGANTCFAPMSGAQFMEHTQTPFRDVSLYMRQTAMIDVGDAESYLFDVVRVRGGKTHTYCLNAFPGQFESNMKMGAVSTTNNPNLNECLQGYYDARQSEGNNPPVLQADWRMAPFLQKYYQDQSMAFTSRAEQMRHLQDPRYIARRYDPNRVTTTRLSLLGHAADQAMVGRWSTMAPDLDYWNLYVQGKPETEGKESVYPGIIETFAGKPFLGGKRLVSVSPAEKGAEASVGVEVRTVDGRTDLLYSSGRQSEVVTVDGRFRMSGKFAMVSRDEGGFRQMAIVGGSELGGEDVLLKPDRASYDVDIVDANYDECGFAVARPFPAILVKGEYVNIDVNGKLYKRRIAALRPQGERIWVHCERTAKVFQSNLSAVDEEAGLVSTETEPYTVRVGMTVTNEKQDRFWRVAELPEGLERRIPPDRVGKPSRWWKLSGDVKKADFTDANGDGRIKVGACQFGPGDRMEADTYVNVARTGKGAYQVHSNVACAVGLPKGEFRKVEVSVGGSAFAPIAFEETDRMLIVSLSEAELVGGAAVLRLTR